MHNRWNDATANQCATPLDLRIYTSRLLGADPALVLHGGGNTSVKITAQNMFGDTETILYVKGSGDDPRHDRSPRLCTMPARSTNTDGTIARA
jgi:rhamnose utilization protein RhaD (predicted bifunctional aldolase and dehydrogenase)